jgi:hypothetical protein
LTNKNKKKEVEKNENNEGNKETNTEKG